MFHMLRFLSPESDTALTSGCAGGLLGYACVGSRRSAFLGASIGILSAMFGGSLAAKRYEYHIKSLESSVGTLNTDLSGLDLRFTGLLEESSDTASRVGWASEDARIASKSASGIEAGLMELERH